MKVFVYTKNGSRKVHEMIGVTSVRIDKENKQIIIEYEDEFFGTQKVKFSTKKYKTVKYQN